MSSESVRVLLLAEAANPSWRSVPLVGWSHCEAIAQQTDAHLVTQVRNRDAILKEGWREPDDFTAIDSEAIAYPIYRATSLLRGGAGKGWTTDQAFSTVSYYYFEYLVWRKFKEELKAGRFDIVHRVTPMSPTKPSPMAKWCHSIGVPFVLGPLNGGLPWPSEFPDLARQENEWLAKFRDFYHYLPYQKLTRECSAAVLAGSRNVYEGWNRQAPQRTFYMPENGLDLDRLCQPRNRKAKLPIEVLFVGRMVPYKGADLLIEALGPLIRGEKVRLKLIGDGPHKPALIAQVDRLGLQHGVDFHKPVRHSELGEHYAAADIFGFPSLRELGGAVVIEAMAQGMVPVVVDYGGPPEFLTPETGVVLPMGDRAKIVSSMRRAVATFVDDPSKIHRISSQARAEARRRFSWQRKASDDVRVYEWLLGRGPRPDLSPPSPYGHPPANSLERNSAEHRPVPRGRDSCSKVGDAPVKKRSARPLA